MTDAVVICDTGSWWLHFVNIAWLSICFVIDVDSEFAIYLQNVPLLCSSGI